MKVDVELPLEEIGGDPVRKILPNAVALSRLRAIAARLLRRERPGHTLQPTALVSELFLKLRRMETRITNEEHFFRLAARAMRQVLIDHGRASQTRKAVTAELLVESLREISTGALDPRRSMEVRDVLQRLKRIDAAGARVIWLRAVEGQTWEETASELGCEIWRARRDYDFAVQWMASRLRPFDSVARSSSDSCPAQSAESAGRRAGTGL